MFKRRSPEPVAPAEPAWRRQINSILETQIARYPLLIQLRAIWRQLQEEREAQLILIPFLIVLFVGFYRAERAKVRELQRRVDQ